MNQAYRLSNKLWGLSKVLANTNTDCGRQELGYHPLHVYKINILRSIQFPENVLTRLSPHGKLQTAANPCWPCQRLTNEGGQDFHAISGILLLKGPDWPLRQQLAMRTWTCCLPTWSCFAPPEAAGREDHDVPCLFLFLVT